MATECNTFVAGSAYNRCDRHPHDATHFMPPPPRPHWSTITVAGHECELYEPPQPRSGRAVIYFHGVRERWLQELPGLRDQIEAAAVPAIAPRAGRSWWLDKRLPAFDPEITAERYVVEHVRAELERRFGVQPPGIGLIGTSMGGQGALRLSYRYPQLFPVAAAIAPAIDFHLAMREAGDRDDGEYYDTLWTIYGDVERARQDTAILHVHPLNWPRHQCFASDPSDLHWHDGAARLHSKLVALGIPHVALLEARVGPGEGHSTVYYDRIAPEIMQFVLDALDAESRRIP
jgi:S-formylglutathione hydrolase FrmB